MQLSEFRKMFVDYQESVSQQIKAGVREKVNSIDGEMKQMASKFKDLSVKTNKQLKLEEFKSKQINLYNTSITIDNMVINKDGSVVQGGGSTDPKMIEEIESLKKHE